VDILLLASAHAGSAETDAVAAACAVLAQGGSVELVETGTVEELDAALARREGRRLVLAGGDGSLHLVLSRLHRRGQLADVGPVGLVPLGTGNDLARALGLPLEPEAAAAVARDGAARRLDLVRDDHGGVVVNAAHLGIGAQAAMRAGRFKRRLGPLAYPLGALAAGFRRTGWPMVVDVDDTRLADGRRPLLMLGIGNGPGIGGGTELLPGADPGDGLLDVVAVFATGPLARVGFGAALAAGRHTARRDVRVARGRAVSVAVRGAAVDLNADGELGATVRRRSWYVEPGAWQVLVPRASGG